MSEAPFPIRSQTCCFALGTIVGSFLNVCIHRIPREASIVHPGSRCPACEAPIAPYDNVPLVSYLMLKGRCRKCGRPISARYPLVGLLTGGIFLLCFRVAGISVELPALLVFSCLLVVISFIDIDFRIIPYRLSLGGLGLGLAFSPLRPSLGFVHAVVGALVGCGLIYAIRNRMSFCGKGRAWGVEGVYGSSA